MTQNHERRVMMYSAVAIFSIFAMYLTLSFTFSKSHVGVQVYKGDVVKFNWTPDNVFYSKTCTDYGTAIDQYGGDHPAYKVMIACTNKNKVEFISILIQPSAVISSRNEVAETPVDDLFEQ